ncbi:MAG: 2Fe-2S iron-sulfur cluster-binding protein [Steroidobacteraceae bacterium]
MLKFQALTVREVRPEAEDAVRVILDVPPDLREMFRAQPGAHLVLRGQLGADDVRRTYSLTGAAGEQPLTLGVRVHPEGRFSRFVAGSLRAGDRLEAMPPNGSLGAALTQAAQAPGGATLVAFAAGCGLTPILSIVSTALRDQPGTRVILFYGNRSSARTMFLEDLQALKDRYLARLALHFVMSEEPQDVALLNGRIDGPKVRELAGQLFEPRAVAAYFLCGPGTMIEEVTAMLRALGVEAARVHSEHFAIATTAAAPAAQGTDTARVAHAAAGAGESQVTVVMDGRRRSFTMRTGAETILDAAAQAGFDLPYSCRAGVCSTCRTRLTRGEVEMQQNYALEDWELERGFILACQSRARSPELELDYDAK